MKNLLMLVLLCLSFTQMDAQNFSIAIYNETFTSCPTDIDNLERLPLNKQGYTDKYTKDGLPYTGCAKTVLKMSNGEAVEYRVTDISEGYPTKELFYFTNGTLSKEFNYKNGRSHGLQIMYYEDGGKYIEENYEFGRKHGTIKRWTKEGKLARDGFFNLDMPIFDIEYFKDERSKC